MQLFFLQTFFRKSQVFKIRVIIKILVLLHKKLNNYAKKNSRLSFNKRN